jgi:alkylation response protein AidB-like acyl-CoA dehydrogenase
VHRYLRKKMREFVDTELAPYAEEWERNCEKTGEYVPREVFRKMGKLGILRAFPGHVSWGKGNKVKDIPGAPGLPFGVPEGQFDYFCEQVMSDELGRIAHPAASACLTIGPAVGTTPIIQFGSTEIINKVIPELLNGECSLSLAVTEPHAGSDVQGLQTTAKLSDDGKHFIVNGEKKWITGGMLAKYFLAAVRTGGPGSAGISMLLLERGPGLTTRPARSLSV